MKEAGPGSRHGFGFHLQTLIIRKLNFYQNYNAFTLILRTKIVQCSIFPWTKCINSTCFDMGFRASLERAWLKHVTHSCRRWSSNPSGKCSYERPTRGTVCGTMRSMCGADAGCLAINYQSLPHSTPTQTRDLISHKISESRFAEVNCHINSST